MHGNTSYARYPTVMQIRLKNFQFQFSSCAKLFLYFLRTSSCLPLDIKLCPFIEKNQLRLLRPKQNKSFFTKNEDKLIWQFMERSYRQIPSATFTKQRTSWRRHNWPSRWQNLSGGCTCRCVCLRVNWQGNTRIDSILRIHLKQTGEATKWFPTFWPFCTTRSPCVLHAIFSWPGVLIADSRPGAESWTRRGMTILLTTP